MLRDKINNDVKDAMKAGDKRRVSTLRLVNAAIMERETRGPERTSLNEADILDVMVKMIKQREESLAIYEQAGRADLAAQEREEIVIISSYLPRKMVEHEMHEEIVALIKELGAATMKDMGRTIATLKERFGHKMDIAKASVVVKRLLGREH